MRRSRLTKKNPTIKNPTGKPHAYLDQLQDLIKRRREARYTYTLVDNGVLESLITEARLYRTKYDSASRRQRGAARVAQRRKPTGGEVMANLHDLDPEGGAV